MADNVKLPTFDIIPDYLFDYKREKIVGGTFQRTA